MAQAILQGHIRIDRNPGNEEVIIATHGGYTPRRGCFRSGSGQTTVPGDIHDELQLHFYSRHNEACVGTDALSMLRYNQPVDPDYPEFSALLRLPGCSETAEINDVIENYSLSHHDRAASWELPEYSTYDLLRVTRGHKVHMADIWAAFRALGLQYKAVHSFACRVNKLTYTFGS